MDKCTEILSRFTDADGAEFREILSGHINSTYEVRVNGRHLILQRINGYVFRDADKVMKNIFGVTDYIAGVLKESGVSADRRVLRYYRTMDDEMYVRDENGDAWRLCDFIDGATAYDMAENGAMLYETGRAFGEFQRLLSDYPAGTLYETIPLFHDTTDRYRKLENAAKNASPERMREAQDVYDAFMARKSRLCLGAEMLRSGELPLRVTHNDTKINNVMIDDATGKGLCVIDLDTVMPGGVLNDFGDGIRTAAAIAAEDEKDLSKVGFSLEAFRSFAEGFLSETRGSLTQAEKETLVLGCEAMTGEVGVRFLTDHLENDVYFRVAYPGHNLVRARNQLAMLMDIEKKRDEAESIIRSLTGD